MTQDTATILAAQLLADTASAAPYASLRTAGAPLPLPLAYEVQLRFVGLQQAEGSGRCAGYKIGLTNPAMQRMCGVEQPVAGQVLADRIYDAPANVALSPFIRLGIECELMVRLARPLPALSQGMKSEMLLDYIDAVAPGFELVEDRDADYSALDASSIIAENGWNRGIVIGSAKSPAAFGDLSGLAGTLYVDDAPIAQGESSDVMGGPLEVLAWLGRTSASVGYRSEPGQWIATGAIIPTKFPQAGQTFRFELTGFSPVTLTLN